MNDKIMNERFEEMTEEEFEYVYGKFLEMCAVVVKALEKGEYCRTCKDVFDTIEKKHLDVSGIVLQDEYDKIKERLIIGKYTGVPLGDVPEPKYDTRTPEGRMKFYRDNPDMRNIVF